MGSSPPAGVRLRALLYVRPSVARSVGQAPEERALQLPSGVPVVWSMRTAYAGDRPVEVLDVLSHGEMVSFRFKLEL